MIQRKSNTIEACKALRTLGETGIKADDTVFYDTAIKTGSGYPCVCKYHGVWMLLAVREQGADYKVRNWDEQGAPVDFTADKTELEIVGRVIQVTHSIDIPNVG